MLLSTWVPRLVLETCSIIARDNKMFMYHFSFWRCKNVDVIVRCFFIYKISWWYKRIFCSTVTWWKLSIILVSIVGKIFEREYLMSSVSFRLSLTNLSLKSSIVFRLQRCLTCQAQFSTIISSGIWMRCGHT